MREDIKGLADQVFELIGKYITIRSENNSAIGELIEIEEELYEKLIFGPFESLIEDKGFYAFHVLENQEGKKLFGVFVEANLSIVLKKLFNTQDGLQGIRGVISKLNHVNDWREILSEKQLTGSLENGSAEALLELAKHNPSLKDHLLKLDSPENEKAKETLKSLQDGLRKEYFESRAHFFRGGVSRNPYDDRFYEPQARANPYYPSPSSFRY